MKIEVVVQRIKTGGVGRDNRIAEVIVVRGAGDVSDQARPVPPEFSRRLPCSLSDQGRTVLSALLPAHRMLRGHADGTWQLPFQCRGEIARYQLETSIGREHWRAFARSIPSGRSMRPTLISERRLPRVAVSKTVVTWRVSLAGETAR
jgi:hypothetical protein